MLQAPSLHEQVRDRLRGMIVRGTLRAGSDIGEAALSERLGTSRTPLREALKLLQAEGLVELRSHRGAFVAPVDVDEAPDAFAVVAALEQLAAERAATRMTAAALDALARMQDCMEREHRQHRMEAYFTLNQRIHRAVVAGSGSATLRSTHALVFARVERLRRLALRGQARWDESIAEHRAVLAALRARDAAAAGAAMGHHVRRTGLVAHRILLEGASHQEDAP